MPAVPSRRQGALLLVDSLLRADPIMQARNSWGMALKKCGRYSEAITHFRASVRLDPECTLAYHNLGASLRQTNDLAGAIAAYNASLKVDPTDALTW